MLDRVEVATWVVNSLKNLADALVKGSSDLDRQKWTNEAQMLLEQIRNTSERFLILCRSSLIETGL